MAVKRVSNSNRSTAASGATSGAASAAPLSLTTEQEIVLLDAFMRNKPAGLHRHFRMALIVESVNEAFGGDPVVTSAHLCQFLDTMYDMEKVEEIERRSQMAMIQQEEFSLNRREFAGIIREMKKNGEIKKDDQEDQDDQEEQSEAESTSEAAAETQKTSKSGTKRPTRGSASSTPAKRKRTN